MNPPVVLLPYPSVNQMRLDFFYRDNGRANNVGGINLLTAPSLSNGSGSNEITKNETICGVTFIIYMSVNQTRLGFFYGDNGQCWGHQFADRP